MANGVYGLTIPINIPGENLNDSVEIYYNYRQTRAYDSSNAGNFKRLDASVLTKATRAVDNTTPDAILEGLYSLQLPVSEFSAKGFYTIYIKPKDILTSIMDIGTLQAFPDVKGIVIDTSTLKGQTKINAQTNNGLAGYRIVYLDDSGNRQSYHRIITSNNRCEALVQAASSSSDKNVCYRYNEGSTLSFLTVTPSSAPSFKSNVLPFIGKPMQKIMLVNTLFEPIMLDIEMVDHDADTISTMLEGNQVRSLDTGLITTFDENNQIYHQAEHFSLKDQATGKPVYEVKNNRKGNIDFTQTISDKIQ